MRKTCRAPFGCPGLLDGHGQCEICGWRARGRKRHYDKEAYRRRYGPGGKVKSRIRKLRPRVFGRQLGICAMCGSLRNPTPAQELDHIVPLAQGGTNDDDNLQALCRACHAKKTASELQ